MKQISVSLPGQEADSHRPLKISSSNLNIERFERLKEEYNFTSKSEAARYFLNLGMMSMVETDPRHTGSGGTDEPFNPVTIRELIPEGKDNSVDISGEFWDEILRDEMLDIVEEDPEIKRDGYEAYR